MSEISKFRNFWPKSTYYTSKESIFHVKFNFIQKKYNFMQKNEKNNFSDFFVKIEADQLPLTKNFLKL